MTQYQERVLGAPVPQEWIERFETLSKQTGRSLTELVREAIAQYIGVDEETTSLELKQEINQLKQKVAEVEPYQQQLKSLSSRLQILEQQLNQAQARDTVHRSSPPAVLEDDDDFDDEPDEILTDFLPN